MNKNGVLYRILAIGSILGGMNGYTPPTRAKLQKRKRSLRLRNACRARTKSHNRKLHV